METDKGEVRRPRGALADRLTCPLCKDLFREASAFAECLHTFCRECIMKKIDDEEIDSCPVCNVYLGVAPEEKLRPDLNLQSIRNKLFPLKTEAAASKVPTITSPAKRKERSLSSLVVETQKTATHTSLTGQRTKAARRTTTSHLSSIIDNGTMRLLNNSEGRDHKTEKTSAPQSTKMTTSANKTQINADIVASNQPSSEDGKNREAVDNEELQKPIHNLVAASGKRSLRLSLKRLNAAAKEDRTMSTNGKLSTRKDGTVDKLAIAGLKLSAHSNKTTTEHNLKKIPEADARQEVVGYTSTGSLHDGITTPIWLSLVTSPNQLQDKLLPQIPIMNLRIKDRSVQVSSILTYITKKLELESDDKLEILCNEWWPICPSTTLGCLHEQWLSSKPKEKVRATVGDPAKEFVMELSYRRRPAALSLCCMMKTKPVTTSLRCYCMT
ncbi:E3 ubiquitin protein ligase DRIP2-like [Lolium rigidum]|uniref:E3 ubiquitin protein ligase DRIP2-like n=1 Tax=Lolium rigidum TaxID=89674 RepID=UPI001F5C7497|nr:E3 ubiquitin protein ligase DRIP2-like [Lolium rigidum]